VQFHAKYPLFDSQSELEFTFSYAILNKMYMRQQNLKHLIKKLNKLDK